MNEDVTFDLDEVISYRQTLSRKIVYIIMSKLKCSNIDGCYYRRNGQCPVPIRYRLARPPIRGISPMIHCCHRDIDKATWKQVSMALRNKPQAVIDDIYIDDI